MGAAAPGGLRPHEAAGAAVLRPRSESSQSDQGFGRNCCPLADCSDAIHRVAACRPPQLQSHRPSRHTGAAGRAAWPARQPPRRKERPATTDVTAGRAGADGPGGGEVVDEEQAPTVLGVRVRMRPVRAYAAAPGSETASQ